MATVIPWLDRLLQSFYLDGVQQELLGGLNFIGFQIAKTGGLWDIQVNPDLALDSLTIDGGAGTNRDLAWTTDGVRRMVVRVNATAEGGADAGSNLDVLRYTDAGVSTLAARLIRSTGVLQLFANLDMTDNAIVNALTVEAQRTGRSWVFGAISDPARGTAAASGGTLTEGFTVNEDEQYEFEWHVTGVQATTGYVFSAKGVASVVRVAGQSAYIMQDDSGTTTAKVLSKCLVDPTDGTDTGAAADEIAISFSIVSNAFRVTVTNNSASYALDMTSAGIALGGSRVDL